MMQTWKFILLKISSDFFFLELCLAAFVVTWSYPVCNGSCFFFEILYRKVLCYMCCCAYGKWNGIYFLLHSVLNHTLSKNRMTSEVVEAEAGSPYVACLFWLCFKFISHYDFVAVDFFITCDTALFLKARDSVGRLSTTTTLFNAAVCTFA